ncbi:MAG: glycosyltransferase family 2 protein [Patescibacteria group bacterium]
MPFVYIIILNWNGLKDTIECLESLKKITYSNYKMIVVDNGSKNDEGRILKEKFGDYIHLIKNDKNYGFAEGNNIGIRYAIKNGADYVLLLNNDTVVEPNFLDEMVKTIEINKHKKVGAIAAKIKNYFRKNIIDTAWIEVKKTSVLNAAGYQEKDSFKFNERKFVFGASGGCALYKKSMLEDLYCRNGYYLDNDLFAYYEDIDLAWRAQYLGWKCIYEPTAVVYHKHSRSLGEDSPLKAYLRVRNHILVLFKNLPVLLFIKYFIIIMIVQLHKYIVFRRNLYMVLKSQIDAIKKLSYFYKKRKLILKNLDTKNLNFLS